MQLIFSNILMVTNGKKCFNMISISPLFFIIFFSPFTLALCTSNLECCVKFLFSRVEPWNIYIHDFSLRCM